MRRFVILAISNIFGLAELLLLIRVVLKALSASAQAQVVRLIYQVTDWLIVPVEGIFSNASFQFGVIDVVAITAMIFYLIAFGIIFKLVMIMMGRG